MQGIKLVTFDATNTLLKFKIPPWQYYSLVAKDHGFTGTEEILKLKMKDSFKIMSEKHPNFGKSDITWENWWKKIVELTFKGQLPGSVNIDIIANKLIEEFRTAKCWVVADGGSNLLDLLRKNGVCIGVISNFDPRLNDILRNITLYHKFDFVLTSYEVGYSKPDKRIFNHAIETCNKAVIPSESLHIGDDFEKDYKGARAAGWHALLVTPNKHETPPALEHVFTNLEELGLAIKQSRVKL